VAGSHQVRRAKAIGVLADPVQALDLYERTRDERLAQWLQQRTEHEPAPNSSTAPDRAELPGQTGLMDDREPETDPADAVGDFDPDQPVNVGAVENWLYNVEHSTRELADVEPPDRTRSTRICSKAHCRRRVDHRTGQTPSHRAQSDRPDS
jgi:hypothetical protein